MPNDLVPNPRKRKPDFFQQFLSPEQQEDEGVFGLGRYQPMPEFETPRQQGPAPAPGMLRLGQGNLAPAPTPNYPPPSEPTPASYAEQYRRGHEKPELAPAPGLSKKRRIGAAIAAFAAEFGRPGAGYRVGQQILYGPRERTEAEHERKLLTWKGGLEEARERDIGEGRRIQQELGQERLTRLRQTPIQKLGETGQEAFERRKREATNLGLEAGSPEYTEYVSQRDLGYGPRYPQTIRRTLPGGETQFLERMPGEEY